ncbi:uncharacterized protein LOC116298221 [Actinia tenebrosa]|uniref:D-serine dehydratase n=1 Tax=Actinia tenebrosa TaxID=6105 RepID=A0A6P8IC31_ACTTE|nr:uncharacterized protein LOC116298221 [Actinia tenebrosa]
MKITELRTPALLVDLEKLKKNCEDMIERCKTIGVVLRPHMKTHKTLEAAHCMTGGTKKCIVVSTLSEAEFYADGGYDDITYGFPITPDKLPQAASLVKRLEKFHVFVDNDVILKALVDFSLPEGKKWSVFLKVDCGKGRAGVLYDDPQAITLAKAITSETSLMFAGLYLHCGDSYRVTGEDSIRKHGKTTYERIVGLVNRLKESGIVCPTVGVGSTPNCSKPIPDIQGITEFHPGNYVFYDYQQTLTGSCKIENVAVKVLTRVIGVYPSKGQILVDCGFTALSQDGMRRLPQDNFCFIDGHPNLKMVALTQEIGKIMAAKDNDPIDYSKYPIGSFLWIIPYHVLS